MSDTSISAPQSELVIAPNDSDVGDYIALMKPRVMSLVIFTALVGLVLAPVPVHPVLAVAALICIACGAGASGALNMWYDADIDANMQRTTSRPIPRGRISPDQALTFGTILAFGSVLVLGLVANWFAAALLALTIGFYIFIYTMLLKRRTPQNIVIGGAAGAFPPMIGWAVATGSVGIESILLFAIIFLWTPPHFWALSLYRMRDYERVGVPMLPVVAGLQETRKQILIYTVLLVGFSLAPLFVNIGGIAYALGATLLGLQFFRLAFVLWRQEAEDHKPAKRLFLYSIVYLFALYAILLVEKIVAAPTLLSLNVWGA